MNWKLELNAIWKSFLVGVVYLGMRFALPDDEQIIIFPCYCFLIGVYIIGNALERIALAVTTREMTITYVRDQQKKG